MVKAGEGPVAGTCGWVSDKVPGEGWKSQGVQQGQSWMAAASDEAGMGHFQMGMFGVRYSVSNEVLI